MNRKKEREQSATAESLAEESPREAKYSPPSVARKRAHMGPKASSSKKTVKQPVNKADQIDALKEYERSWRVRISKQTTR
jgi:hypothetical protein